ncbi:MAG: 7-carboxy-7-deazaguanine synthase [Deltaproteobacteria bacterium]|nr:7-carboxy-7-deazaguanine synthase [Deltaproteobacteria bacterium]
MSYAVKEIFYSIQGEGFHTGRPAVFCRFSGCNLWNGKEKDRQNALCGFCDTDFMGTNGTLGGVYSSPRSLAETIKSQGAGLQHKVPPLVVCTGGEPLLQLDQPLIKALHKKGFFIAVETNGTLIPPQGIDWITVSPKSGVDLKIKSGDEIKIVYPQKGLDPAAYALYDFKHHYLQPLDDADKKTNTAKVFEYCLKHPQWRISVQLQKCLGVR